MVEAEIGRATQQAEFREAEPPEESLFDHYSVENEADFLRKIDHLSTEEKRFYVRENMLGFLGEYAGKIHYKKISYILKNRGLDFAGVSMQDLYQKVLSETEVGGREWYETQGMLQVEEQIAQPSVNVATVISPPKAADYGLVFHFVKGDFDSKLDGTPVAEYILRYPERTESIVNSLSIARDLTYDPALHEYFHSGNDFLVTPFFSYQPKPKQELNRLLSIMKIDEQLIAQSKEFEKIAEEQLSDWMDRYFVEVSVLSRLSPVSLAYGLVKNDAEMLLGAMYNKARIIKETIDALYVLETKETVPLAFQFLVNRDSYSKETIELYINAKPLTVTGGNCPVAKKKSPFGLDTYLSISDIYEELLKGNTLESILDNENNVCKECGKESSDHHYHCPDCGHQYPDETNRPVELRTKECKCGFHFKC